MPESANIDKKLSEFSTKLAIVVNDADHNRHSLEESMQRMARVCEKMEDSYNKTNQRLIEHSGDITVLRRDLDHHLNGTEDVLTEINRKIEKNAEATKEVLRVEISHLAQEVSEFAKSSGDAQKKTDERLKVLETWKWSLAGAFGLFMIVMPIVIKLFL